MDTFLACFFFLLFSLLWVLHGSASAIDYTLYVVRPALALGCIVLLGEVAGHYILYTVLAGLIARLLVYLHHCTVSIWSLLPVNIYCIDSDVVAGRCIG